MSFAGDENILYENKRGHCRGEFTLTLDLFKTNTSAYWLHWRVEKLTVITFLLYHADITAGFFNDKVNIRYADISQVLRQTIRFVNRIDRS